MKKFDPSLPHYLDEGGVARGGPERTFLGYVKSNNLSDNFKETDPSWVLEESTAVSCKDGHAYGEDGKCTRCGETNPSWVLEKKYSAAQEQLERNKQSAQQRASVSLAKLQKYLPHMIKQQGLQGLGVSQTAALRANNSYNTQMGTIDRDYNTAASDLFANYADGKVALESAAASDRLAREQLDLQKYQIETQTKQTEEANAEAKALSVYNDIIGMIDNGDFKSSTELNAYIDANRETLGDYADRLDIIAGTRGEYIDEVAAEEEAAQASKTAVPTGIKINSGDKNTGIGDNFSLVDTKGTKYRVEFGEEITDDTIKNAASGVANGIVFKYDGVLYVKKNNTVYKIQQRPSAKGHYDSLYDYASIDKAEAEASETIKTTDVKFNKNNKFIFGASDFRDGDNFSVKDSSGNVYRVESGGVVTDDAIKSAANKVNDGVFGYKGDLYLKKGDDIYKIKKRESQGAGRSGEVGYNALYKQIYG